MKHRVDYADRLCANWLQ